jgi:hypothetical protein
MTYPTAIVISAGLIAGALMLSGRADSQSTPTGKFVGVGVSENGTIAWRLDTGTGEMSQCTVSGQRIVCLKP